MGGGGDRVAFLKRSPPMRRCVRCFSLSLYIALDCDRTNAPANAARYLALSILRHYVSTISWRYSGMMMMMHSSVHSSLLPLFLAASMLPSLTLTSSSFQSGSGFTVKRCASADIWRVV